jgi:hypothetical protein
MLYRQPEHQIQSEVFTPHSLGSKESGRSIFEFHCTLKSMLHGAGLEDESGMGNQAG